MSATKRRLEELEHEPLNRNEIQAALDYLLDLAELHYPGYYHDSEIGAIDDIYKKYFG
jgi:hypothetical protein